MSRKKLNPNNRQAYASYIAIPHELLESDAYKSLSTKAVKCLLDIAAQFKGKNNGDLSCTFSLMKKRNWKSKDTLESARKEILKAGFIVLTRQGGRNSCSLYAITWKPIDECNGKHDSKPDIIPKHYWKNGCNPEVQYVGEKMICCPV